MTRTRYYVVAFTPLLTQPFLFGFCCFVSHVCQLLSLRILVRQSPCWFFCFLSRVTLLLVSFLFPSSGFLFVSWCCPKPLLELFGWPKSTPDKHDSDVVMESNQDTKNELAHAKDSGKESMSGASAPDTVDRSASGTHLEVWCWRFSRLRTARKCSVCRYPNLITHARCIGRCLRFRLFALLTRFRRVVGSPSFTDHLCAEDITQAESWTCVKQGRKEALLEDGVLLQKSSAQGRACVMCPVRIGSPKLLPRCLCENWRHVGCSYETHLGRARPCHIRILDPKGKIMVLSHPYMEDYLALPTRSGIRSETRLVGRDPNLKKSQDDQTLSRRCSAT